LHCIHITFYYGSCNEYILLTTDHRKAMIRFIKKIIVVTLLVVTMIVTGIAALVLFPQPLFANKFEHKNISVYSNKEIHSNIISTLDRATEMLSSCELYEPNYHYDIFLCDGSCYNNIDSKLFGDKPTGRSIDNNVIIKIPIDIEKNIGFTRKGNVTLTWLFTHEMTHCLQENKFGALLFNPLHQPPTWKVEGYADYVATIKERKSVNYNFIKEIDRYNCLAKKSTDGAAEVYEGHISPLIYFKGRLLLEYLIDIRKIKYEDVLSNTITEDSAFEEMMMWSDTQKQKRELSLPSSN
jgi:hypothetical protein